MLHPILRCNPLATSPPALSGMRVVSTRSMDNPAGDEPDADAPTRPEPSSETVVSLVEGPVREIAEEPAS